MISDVGRSVVRQFHTAGTHQDSFNTYRQPDDL